MRLSLERRTQRTVIAVISLIDPPWFAIKVDFRCLQDYPRSTMSDCPPQVQTIWISIFVLSLIDINSLILPMLALMLLVVDWLANCSYIQLYPVVPQLLTKIWSISYSNLLAWNADHSLGDRVKLWNLHTVVDLSPLFSLTYMSFSFNESDLVLSIVQYIQCSTTVVPFFFLQLIVKFTFFYISIIWSNLKCWLTAVMHAALVHQVYFKLSVES